MVKGAMEKMKWIWDVLRGMIIGLANIIPGVSGGTMMVSMGIYDTLIYCITHLFKEFKRSFRTLLPYAVGMALAIAALSFAFEWAFANYPLPINALFIGLILGGLPAIMAQLKGEKKGTFGLILFLLAAGGLVLLNARKTVNVAVIELSLVEVIRLFLIGALASATMVIPGVSGSMVLKILGYYEPIVTGALPALLKGAAKADWAAAAANIGILLPFMLGILVGIFVIAKLIETLLKKWKGYTYCAILGLVAASPVVILMSTPMEGATLMLALSSLAAFALGFWAAWSLAKKEGARPA